MTVQMLKGKIHRATVKQAELNYVGSITVDADLLDAAGIYEYEKVAIVDIENGNRFETYTIAGERGSGMICLNGAAARCAEDWPAKASAAADRVRAMARRIGRISFALRVSRVGRAGKVGSRLTRWLNPL